MPGHRPPALPFCGFLSLAAFGAGPACSPSYYREDADREVDVILQEFDAEALGGREDWVLLPEELPPEVEEGDALLEDDPDALLAEVPGDETVVIDLESTLGRAFQYNRAFQTRRESLYLSGLSHTLTLYNFGIQYDSAVSFLWSDQEDGSESRSGDVSFNARSPILPTGGSLRLGSNFGGSQTEGFGKGYDGRVSLGLTQPLLRGAGYEPSHEGLTQGTRNLIYAVREFELDRENLTIDFARQYYQLVGDQKSLENLRTSHEQAIYDRRKNEAMRDVGRQTEQDVVQARRREIQSEDALVQRQQQFEASLDRFKIDLGLPPSVAIELVPSEPLYEPIRLDWNSAVEVAMHNNLNLITQEEQLEDQERQLRLARNDLLPNADLTANSSLVGSGDKPSEAEPDLWSLAAGITFEIPLQQVAERNNYRRSLINTERARRNFQEFVDELERSIMDQLRELRRLEAQYDLQVDQIASEEKNILAMEVRKESGEVEQRDLNDARNSLLLAQNQLIDIKVDHFITKLSLMRDLGILFIDENGMWR